ncbi:YceI like family protein [Gracilibacillus boraciitolerans JCM 21714]|uniref:YceI like family protein n=1 Tax=Gracilibacillus boraciitolerans JCM 21714 TaxID=1298598 RepID=W4VHT0_9BACI|nr:YceI family protein [Gracilibacillus boraciitolerans]GAE92378.1 YceI like family protein [Gracilibacillus boraciitolerans JCM 21714]
MVNVNLDKVHSALNFEVKHMMVSKAKGEFQNFDVDFNGSFDDLANASVKVTIDAASIETNNPDRNGHLKSGDFFDVENYPNITFVSKNITKAGDSEYKITGDLTIKDVTNEETFTVEYNGTAKDPMQGNTIAGADVEGKINREDYGLTWNAQLETGGVLVGKDVKFSGGFEFVVEE